MILKIESTVIETIDKSQDKEQEMKGIGVGLKTKIKINKKIHIQNLSKKREH